MLGGDVKTNKNQRAVHVAVADVAAVVILIISVSLSPMFCLFVLFSLL